MRAKLSQVASGLVVWNQPSNPEAMLARNLTLLVANKEELRILVPTGPVGMGKLTVGSESARLLREAGLPYALVDLPHTGRAWPPPANDPWNERLTHRNLALMWLNFREAGAGRLILCRVLEAEVFFVI